jgi:hypothetical protein
VDQKQTLKQRLPFPYNQDLSQVLRKVDRRTPFSRSRIANDPVTAAYLAAAMRLIERHFGPGAQRSPVDPSDENSLERPLLGFLSQRAVAAEVSRNPHPFPRVGSVPTLRSTWRSHSDFIADLLRFGLWSQYHPARWESDRTAAAIEELIDGAEPDFAQSIHELSYHNLMIFVARPRFRLRLVAVAAAEGDEVIREALGELYHEALVSWRTVFVEVLRNRGLQLRPGVQPDDFVNMLAAVAEGTAVHALSAPSPQVIDHEHRRTLLGTAALALIHGCLERVDEADGSSLEQAVHAKVYGTLPPGEQAQAS